MTAPHLHSKPTILHPNYSPPLAKIFKPKSQVERLSLSPWKCLPRHNLRTAGWPPPGLWISVAEMIVWCLEGLTASVATTMTANFRTSQRPLSSVRPTCTADISKQHMGRQNIDFQVFKNKSVPSNQRCHFLCHFCWNQIKAHLFPLP